MESAQFEVFDAVAAVISAFHGGAELLTHVEKKTCSDRSIKVEVQDVRQLKICLEMAELQLSFRFSTEEARFGDVVRVGDAIARDRLHRIAVNIQTDIIMSLQLAAKYKNAMVDFKALHVAAVTSRKDAIESLDELKQRILLPSFCTVSNIFDSPNYVPGSRTTPASRSVSPRPVPLLKTASNPATGNSVNGLSSQLVRYFYDQRRGRAVSNPASYFDVLDSARNSSNFRPALHYLLQGKTSQERALIMKDIDEIIVAYQGLRIEGDRADALARLTGNQEDSRRDTWAVLQGGLGYQRETKALHQDALRLLKELPALPQGENTEYPAYVHNVLDAEDERRLSEWVEQQKQNDTALVSRWSITSAGSSVYSQDTECSSGPPSLCHHDSRPSSQASGVTPGTTPREPASPITQCTTSMPVSRHAIVPFWSLDTMKLPPNSSSLESSRTNSPMSRFYSRTNSPVRQHQLGSLAPISASRRPITPTNTNLDASLEPRGRSRIHILPTENWRPDIDITNSLHLNPVSSESQQSATPTTTSFIPTVFQDGMMTGRPCKANNYWGFCKGAWAAREAPKKGLMLTSRPEGMFSNSQVMQCRHCLFESGVLNSNAIKKSKKDAVPDSKVLVSAGGVRYRWAFLAKSHVKKTSYTSGGRNGAGEEIECCYGCVVCCEEGRVSGVYGSVELLMGHITHEHVWGGRVNDTAVLERCGIVVGRLAGGEEEWDINIVSEEGLLF